MSQQLRISLSDFWDMTPWQLAVRAEGENEARGQAYRESLAIAWHGAAFQRAKRLPALKKIMAPPKEPKPGIDEDGVTAALDAIVARQKAHKRVIDAKNRQS